MSDPACMTRSAENCCALTSLERIEFDRLVAWFLSWQPPAEGYPLSVGVEVVDPKLAHAYYSAEIRKGIGGQQQRHLLWWLRRHAELFGGPS